MATPKKQPAKTPPKAPAPKAEPKKPSGNSGADLFDRMNAWIEKNYKILFWTSIGLCSAFALLVFNIRLDIGGDDASYIERAHNFLHQGKFPSYQGPLYPTVLVPFVAIFGINLFILKFLSLLFTVGQVYFLWRAFRKHAPLLVTAGAVLLTATNYYILLYGSLTYNEAFFMMLQAMLLWLVTEKIPAPGAAGGLREHWKIYLGLSALLVGMFLTRTIAIMSIGAVFFYFLVTRQWKNLVFVGAGTVILLLAYVAFKNVVFPGELQFESQGQSLLLKDPYKKELGNETTAGFLRRIPGNSKLYLSKRIMQILNLKAETNTKSSVGVTLLMYGLILLGIITAFRKKSKLLFAGLYTLIFSLGTFLVLQTRWDQLRLILVVLAPLAITIFGGLYLALKNKRLKDFQFALPLIIAVFVVLGFAKTFDLGVKNIKVLQRNLAGDIWYGYTDDWANYAAMSKWVKDHVPDSAVVLSRKPSMSMLFANGRPFQGIYSVPSTNSDSCLLYLKKNKVDYVLDGSLRRNPYQNTGQIITTVRSVLYYVSQKYPTAIKPVHQIGQKEPAYLYQIIYPDTLH